MGDFFKSARFKWLGALAVVLFALLLHAAHSEGLAPFTSQLLSRVTVPVQRVTAAISESAGSFFESLWGARRLQQEKEALEQEVQQLRAQLVEMQKYKRENEQLKASLEIKEENPEFSFEPATVIGRDAADRFYSFTIDKGSRQGVSYRDPVINADGLVGVVTEVGDTYAKVITILDPMLDVGCQLSRTGDTGVLGGTIALAEQGLAKLSYLAKESDAQPGDLVITSGVGGVFPANIIVGAVEEIALESHGLSLYAAVRPMADIAQVKDVLVIKQQPGEEGTDAAAQNAGS